MLAISQLCVDGLLEGVEGNVLQEEERRGRRDRSC